MTFKKICKYHFCFKCISLFYKQDNAASVTHPRPKFIFDNAEPAQLALVVTAHVIEYSFFKNSLLKRLCFVWFFFVCLSCPNPFPLAPTPVLKNIIPFKTRKKLKTGLRVPKTEKELD